jgi:hypothetical protein
LSFGSVVAAGLDAGIGVLPGALCAQPWHAVDKNKTPSAVTRENRKRIMRTSGKATTRDAR